MTDDFIIKLFIKDNGKLQLNYMKKKWIESHEDIKQYLENRYDDFTGDINYAEIIYRIKHNIDVIPKCIVCGKPALFKNFSYGYRDYCSYECSVKSKKRSDKFRQTYMERYGDLTKDEYKIMYHWVQSHVEKAYNTNIKRYGFKYPTQSDEIKEKIKHTCLKKFGEDNPNKCREVRQKIESTNISKYGTKNAMKSDIVRQKQSLSQKSAEVQLKKEKTWMSNFNQTNPAKCQEIIDKIFATKKKNNTSNSSHHELLVKEFLIKNNIKFMQNYKSELYPFHCDFYLNDFDLYIELNITWTHGFRPYIENDPLCEIQLQKWKEKSVSSNYYKDAINTWTIRDTQKRIVARNNNLNYLEIFDKNSDNILSIIADKIKLLQRYDL